MQHTNMQNMVGLVNHCAEGIKGAFSLSFQEQRMSEKRSSKVIVCFSSDSNSQTTHSRAMVLDDVLNVSVTKKVVVVPHMICTLLKCTSPVQS